MSSFYGSHVGFFGGGVGTAGPPIPEAEVIEQNGNLTAHWDFSKWAQNVGTTWNTSGTTLPDTSGTSIGSSSSTPSMYFTTSHSAYDIEVGSMGTDSLKTLQRNDSTSQNGGAECWGAPAYPDITSSSDPLTIAFVLKPISIRSGWNRACTGAWDSVGSYSGAVVFINSSGNGNYRYVNTGTSTSTAGYLRPYNPLMPTFSTDLWIFMWSFQGTSMRTIYKKGSNASRSYSGTASSTRYYGTETDANRRTYAFEHGYWNGNPSMEVGEIAVWSEYWTTSDMESLVSNLYDKWS
tara:strand:- start:296 stop:1174 length:879 start_codon:yes stop_codon:yes gene_type:complete